jgi:hypothetical protein
MNERGQKEKFDVNPCNRTCGSTKPKIEFSSDMQQTSCRLQEVWVRSRSRNGRKSVANRLQVWLRSRLQAVF